MLSWPASERPTAGQLEASARTLMQELGFGKCPAVWAAHNDTDNLHLHVAVVRFDLQNNKAAELGWDIDALHQAIAIIEHEHGWKPEANALFRVDGSLLCEVRTREPVRDLETGQSFPRERRKSLYQHNSVIAAQLLYGLGNIRDWDHFHREAAQFDIRYVRKGSGARIETPRGSCKASAVHPRLALAKLEAKFGPYEGRCGKNGTTYEGYERSYSSCLDHLRAAKAAAREHLEKVRKQQRAELAALLAEANAKVLLLAFNQAVEHEIAAAREALDKAFRKAKKDLLEARLDRSAWQAVGEPALIDPVPAPSVLFPILKASQRLTPALSGTLARQSHEQHASEFSIQHQHESGRIAFTDHRAMLIVHDAERIAICAALDLAQKRWGAALVSGSALFREQCKAYGAELGIEVVDGGEPPPLIRKPKEAATGHSKRLPDPAPATKRPNAQPFDATLAREAARSRADLARQNSGASKELAADVDASRQQGAASVPAKAAPATTSVGIPRAPESDQLTTHAKGYDGDATPPPEMPPVPPFKRGGWGR